MAQHFKLYKPAGYLSQFINNQDRRRNKRLLSDLGDFPDGTMSVGRLDEKSEGLLFLTTDGKTSYHVQSKKVEKEYFVQVEGQISDDGIAQLRQGLEITIDKKAYRTLPAKARILDPPPHVFPSPRGKRDENKITSWISISIREGKFRQVRKMTAAIGLPTLRLIRVRIGNELLGSLAPGEWHELSVFDLGTKKGDPQ